ncbi:MAG: hypothetical protein HYY04_01725 [Chloroflexi bacterium]|nr:hypothetical protein [Chloroflexota bacterium]
MRRRSGVPARDVAGHTPPARQEAVMSHHRQRIEPAASATGMARQEIQDELLASYAASRELPASAESAVIAKFLDRLDVMLEARIDARVNELVRQQNVRRGSDTKLVAAALALSIPLLGIAGGIAGVTGILAICALIVFLVVFHRYS